MHRQTSNRSHTTNSTPEPFDVFTGGKDPEFAIFFNVAFTKLLRTVHYWETGNKEEIDENDLDTIYGPIIKGWNDNEINTDFSAETYSKLRNYIWKGYLNERNSSGYELTTKDQNLIRALISKLQDLRNFHSHVYHDNKALEFDPKLKKFIEEELHDHAMNSFASRYLDEIEFYQQNYKQHPLFKKNWITQEGRTFFLSLFLTTGEISRFLQQRRGSKKNDELKYRIKHLIYRFYAHRDGAARKYYNQEEALHDSLSDSEMNELLNARQFYKINAFVNDIPEYMHDTDKFPLYIKLDGEFQMCKTVRDFVDFCHDNQIATALDFNFIYTTDDEEKENAIRFFLKTEPDYRFEMGKMDFHRLILDFIRLGEQPITERLAFFVAERKTIISALNEEKPELHLGQNGDTPILLEDYEKYKLRSGTKLKEIFVEWFMSYQNKHTKENTNRRKLLDKLEIAPIEIRHFDTYQGADQRPRTTNRFLEWCVQYCIDFQLFPDWKWAFEKFDSVPKMEQSTGKTKQVLTKTTAYFSQRPPLSDNYRLSINNNHILVKYANDKGERLFSIGENTFRLIMITAITRIDRKDNHTSFVNSLLGRLKVELDTIMQHNPQNGTFNWNLLKLLDAKILPESYLLWLKDRDAIQNAQHWKTKTQKRLEHIINELTEIQNHNIHLSRAQKNEQIMRCFQFFDWKPKFLRQNEYQMLSIYNYSLSRIDELEYKKKKKELRFFENILVDIKAENPNRIPREIADLLKKCFSLEHLLTETLAITINLLHKWQTKLERGPENEQKKIAERLKISTDKTAVKNMVMPPWLPFSVHPLIVVRAFHAEQRSVTMPFLADAKYTSALREENYQNPYSLIVGADSWPGATQRNKKLIGTKNQAVAHDAILWFIAGQYFKEMSPNVRMALNNAKKDVIPAKVGSLRSSQLIIPVNATVNNQLVPAKVSLYFHQFDDTLFIESRKMLERVVAYILHSQQLTPDRYAHITDNTLSYDDITKEIARIQNEALVVAKKILDWEYAIIQQIHQNQPQKIAQAAQQPDGKIAHIPFVSVCALAQIDAETTRILKDLRNTVFHFKIPENTVYRNAMKTPELFQLFGDMEQEWKKDRSAWENNAI